MQQVSEELVAKGCAAPGPSSHSCEPSRFFNNPPSQCPLHFGKLMWEAFARQRSRTMLCAASRQGRSRTGALRFCCLHPPPPPFLNRAMVPFCTFVPLYNSWAGAQR